jgi:hypothetical protein
VTGRAMGTEKLVYLLVYLNVSELFYRILLELNGIYFIDDLIMTDVATKLKYRSALNT